MPTISSLQSPFFTTAEEAADAFYAAFNRSDVSAMMGVWAEDEEIICIHPGAIPLIGFGAVHAAWKSVFTNGQKMSLTLRDPIWHHTGPMATQTVLEWITVGDETQARGGIVATNTFIQTIRGWRLLSHHGSPIAGETHAAGSDVILH
jgi:ketosteroid isomerase-like protein